MASIGMIHLVARWQGHKHMSSQSYFMIFVSVLSCRYRVEVEHLRSFFSSFGGTHIHVHTQNARTCQSSRLLSSAYYYLDYDHWKQKVLAYTHFEV